MSSVKLRNVRKAFGSVEVIKGIDLDITDGELVVFVGPSGCGKSTLLRMIAGLETITGGDIDIGGKRVNDLEPSKRGIAMVFQSYALYPHLTVAENMGFALRFAGASKAEIASKVGAAAQTLELGALLDRRPAELSGGQRQRVAIGRAIVRHPEVFLFDEPLSNLDAELRVHMRIEIARLHKLLASTMIYVTHDQVEAMTLADRIVVLKDGAVAQADTPLRLYDDPDNLFVAGFIGSPKMNFFPAVLESGTVRLTEHGDLVVPVALGEAHASQRVTVGIRPEALGGTGRCSLPLIIEFVEHMGAQTYVHGRVGESGLIIVATDNGRALKAGDVFAARFDPQAMLVFDGNGLRLR